MSQQIAVLNRMKKLLPLKLREKLYRAFIAPHFYYCGESWHFCSNRKSRKKPAKPGLPNSFHSFNHNKDRDDVFKLKRSVQEQGKTYFSVKGFVILFFDEVFILITERLAGKVSTALSFS